jgi:hypothetical protein
VPLASASKLSKTLRMVADMSAAAPPASRRTFRIS